MMFADCHQLTSKLFNSCNCHGGCNCQGKVLWLLVLKAFPTSSQNNSPSYMNSPRTEKTSAHFSATFLPNTRTSVFFCWFLKRRGLNHDFLPQKTGCGLTLVLFLNPYLNLNLKTNKSLTKKNTREIHLNGPPFQSGLSFPNNLANALTDRTTLTTRTLGRRQPNGFKFTTLKQGPWLKNYLSF